MSPWAVDCRSSNRNSVSEPGNWTGIRFLLNRVIISRMWRNHPLESSTCLSMGGDLGKEERRCGGGIISFWCLLPLLSCLGHLPNANAGNDSVYAKAVMLFFSHLIAVCQKSTSNRFWGWQSTTPHRLDSAVILSKVHRASLLSMGHSDKFLKTGTPDCKGRTSKISWGCN